MSHSSMIIRTVLTLLLVLFVINTHATTMASAGQGSSGPFGLGVVLGAPTAITGKYNFSHIEAVDAGISFFASSWVLVYGDYLRSYPGAFGHRDKFVSQLTPYIGIGGGLYSWRTDDYGGRPWGWRDYNNSGGLGLYGRVPLGIEWRPQEPTIGVFFELAPGIAVLPGMWITLDIGIGVRYFF